jgi:hypothetical protein
MDRIVAVVAVVGGLLLASCVGHQERFIRQRIPVSRWCNMTLIEDRRTGTCFVAYHCGMRTSPVLVLAPPEVCRP